MKESCYFQLFTNIEGEEGTTVPTNVPGIVGTTLILVTWRVLTNSVQLKHLKEFSEMNIVIY